MTKLIIGAATIVTVIFVGVSFAQGRECSRKYLEVGACVKMEIGPRGMSFDAAGHFRAYLKCLKQKLLDALSSGGRALDAGEREFLAKVEDVIDNVPNLIEINADGRIGLTKENEVIKALSGMSANMRWNDMLITAKTGTVIEFFTPSSLVTAYSNTRLGYQMLIAGFPIKVGEVKLASGILVRRPKTRKGKVGVPLIRIAFGGQVWVAGKVHKGYAVFVPLLKNGKIIGVAGTGVVPADPQEVDIKEIVYKLVNGKGWIPSTPAPR